jgi:NADPH:quinone reductase-like Zn-dependent oxidoreductase
MKAAKISKAGGDFELVERAIPEPGPGQVRVKVEACARECFGSNANANRARAP